MIYAVPMPSLARCAEAYSSALFFSASTRRARLFGDARGLAAASAQVIELRPAHVAAADELDRDQARRMQREHALHAFAVADLAHGEGGVDAGVLARDDDAFEGLHALAVAFDHLHVDLHGVARREVEGLAARVLVDLRLLELLEDIHDARPFF